MNTAGPLHIALTFDDYFWAPAYATMRSVCLTTRRRADLVFHLFHWHLADENRAILDAIGTEFGARIVHTALAENAAAESATNRTDDPPAATEGKASLFMRCTRVGQSGDSTGVWYFDRSA